MGTTSYKRMQPGRIGWLMAVLLLCSVLPAGASRPEPPQYEPIRLIPGVAEIFGIDNRTRVSDTTEYPYSAIGQVRAWYGNSIHAGTGAMIGKKTVLTAAHVVYDWELGAPDRIEFIPALDQFREPFGRATVRDAVIPDDWTDRQDEEYDIALLALDESLGEQTGVIPFTVQTNTFLAGRTLKSAGYPSDLAGDRMYAVSGSGRGIEGNILIEEIDTEFGQSGSPIWYESGGDMFIVGVIKGTRSLTDNNGQTTIQGIGIHINGEFSNWIRATLTRVGDSTQTTPGGGGDSGDGDGNAGVPPLECGTCGAGTGQALGALTVCYAVCLVSRRTWRNS